MPGLDTHLRQSGAESTGVAAKRFIRRFAASTAMRIWARAVRGSRTNTSGVNRRAAAVRVTCGCERLPLW